jgi:hypothetical protein
MDTPKVLGRSPDEHSTDPRADTRHRLSATVAYCSGAIGEARVDLFESVEHSDCGGFVLRLSIKDDASSMVPHAVVHPSGVDIHLAGDAEAEAILMGIQHVLAAMRERRTAALCSVQVTFADRMDRADR